MGRETRTETRLAVLGLAVAAAVSFIVLVELDSQLTFVADDWLFLVKRHEWSADYFLHPFHGSLVIGLGAAYKAMRELFGMESATPFYVVAILVFVASAVLLFIYLRGRVGDWLALIGAVLILFLGAAFEDLLFAFQLGYFVSVAAGIGVLIALDRDDEQGDRIACVLLILSIGFSSVGLAFLAGALADLVLGRRPWRSRIFVTLVPVVLYGLWWIGWGHLAEQHLSVHNIVTAPKFVYNAASAGIVSLLGLATGDGSEPDQPHLIWGKLLLIVGLILLAVKIARERGIPRGLAVVLVIGLAFWVLTGVNRDVSRLPTSSRYQYPSAVFLLLIAAEMARGIRVPRYGLLLATGISALAVIGGISLLNREHEERWLPYSQSLRSSLGAIELAGVSADPSYPLSFPPDVQTSTRSYLDVTAAYGSPAYDETKLAERPESERAAADLTMAEALNLGLKDPAPGTTATSCQQLQATGDGATGVTLLHGGFTLANEASTPVEVSLGRFADGFSVLFGPVEPDATTALLIPRDNSKRPWRLGLTGAGTARLCATG